jgi:hypothetical protein
LRLWRRQSRRRQFQQMSMVDMIGPLTQVLCAAFRSLDQWEHHYHMLVCSTHREISSSSQDRVDA